MSGSDYKFEGWIGLDASSAEGKMVWKEFEPKPWEETDVDIKITHCGICGSDLHVLRSGWVSIRVLHLAVSLDAIAAKQL
jgi:alcohol dehydrogenase (NADP+)